MLKKGMTRIEAQTIDPLIDRSLEWASDCEHGTFYGESSDGGEVQLNVAERMHEGLLYDAITVLHIRFPMNRQKQGLYRGLLESLDRLGRFGLRCHSATLNDRLADRHRKHNYYEVRTPNSSEFRTVIGAPLPPEVQILRSESDAAAIKRIRASVGKPKPIGKRIKIGS